MQGVYLSGASVRGAISMSQSGIYFDFLKMNYPNKDQIQESAKAIPDTTNRRIFLRRMVEVEKSGYPPFASDYPGFSQARLELLETDLDPQRLLIITIFFDPNFHLNHLNQAIYNRCRTHYPTKYKKLKADLMKDDLYKEYGIKL